MKAKVAGVLALGLLTASMSAGAVIVSVDAAANSATGGTLLDTGVAFTAGDTLTISVAVDDLWSAGSLPRWSNADGLIGDLFATGSDDSGEPAGTRIGANFGTLSLGGFSAPFGALVGEIGGVRFLAGTDFSGVAPGTGTLFLMYWDSNSGDNFGSVSVAINEDGGEGPGPEPVPEPGTLALFALGLAGLGFGFRRRTLQRAATR